MYNQQIKRFAFLFLLLPRCSQPIGQSVGGNHLGPLNFYFMQIATCETTVSIWTMMSFTVLNFFFKVFGGHMSFFGGHWYSCFGFLVTSPLGFKARVGSALFTIFVEANVMYIPQDSPLVLHLPTSWQPARSQSLPHMHVQRLDLAWIRTCNPTDRRRTRYHCASDPAINFFLTNYTQI